MRVEFPLMLYKPGSMFEWDGEFFDYLIVSDADELEIAQADGWSLGKPSEEAPAEAPRRGRPPKNKDVTDA